MNQVISLSQIEELVYANKYKVPESNKLFSRGIDGCYGEKTNLHPLSIPGADVGDLAILYATANMYGFTLDEEKVYETLINIIGGFKNFSYSVDSRKKETGHMFQLTKNPQAYSLEENQIELLRKQIATAKENGALESICADSHREGALLQISGMYDVLPQYHTNSAEGTMPIQTYVFHKTLVNNRHKVLAQKLRETQAVELFDNLDEEYLYQVISSVTEDHLWETIKREAPGVPIYEAIFKEDGAFDVKELGSV